MNKKAVASLVLGCFAILLPVTGVVAVLVGRQIMARVADPIILFLEFVAFPSALAAPVLGHLARRAIRRGGAQQSGAGVAMAGLILGYAGLSVPLMLLASTIPAYFRDRIPENEVMTVGALRDISIGANNYREDHGRYPARLEELAAPGARISGGVGEILRTGKKSGYLFVYATTDANRDGVPDGFTIHADPIDPGKTGRRHFYVDETGVIRMEESRAATRASPEAH